MTGFTYPGQSYPGGLPVITAQVGVTASNTDGADVVAGSVAALVGVSGATIDGSDVVVGAVGVLVELSGATVDGADVAAGNVSVGGAVISTGDAWGGAWGSAWGNSWGSAVVVPAGYSQEVEIRKYYMRKGKKLLMFDSVTEAEAYTQAETLADEAIAKAHKTSRLARKRLRNRIVAGALPAHTIDTDYLAEMMERFAINLDLPALLAQQDYERIMQIHAMAMAMQDEEDDIELLLLMG